MNLPENELHAVTKIQHFDFSTIPLTAMKKSYQWLKMKCMVNLRILSTKAKSEDMIINELLDAEKYLLNKTIENLQGLIDNQN